MKEFICDKMNNNDSIQIGEINFMQIHRFMSVSFTLCLCLSILLTGCKSTGKTADSFSFSDRQFVVAPGASLDIVQSDIAQFKKVSFQSSSPDLVSVNDTGTVQVSAKAPIGTEVLIHANYNGKSTECDIIVKYALKDTVSTNSDGKAVVTNAEDLAVVVNKQRSLPSDYIPNDLVAPNVPFTFKAMIEKRMLRSAAAAALEQLFAQADKEDIHLYGVSGYRSYVTQKSVFAGNVKNQGEAEAAKVSAIPGQSEHQTGLAIDVTNNKPEDQIVESFGSSKEGEWLAAHAADFGFIIRYPKAMESITGYAYEPWHIRYVGPVIAKAIYTKKITLEQYFDDTVAVSH
jgi:D-alanyl-D-alanine carboxypeptidase